MSFEVVILVAKPIQLKFRLRKETNIKRIIGYVLENSNFI